jgi:hydroxymethylbilane synthase
MNRKLIIGTRGSDLALWQAHFVQKSLETSVLDREVEIKIIHTTGDKVLEVALSKIGDKGLFTRQIENELLNGSIDLAVHSLKDLQTEQPRGVKIGAVCKREVPNDIFISKGGISLESLPFGARVATGSLRRRSQLLHYRPDLQISEIRGNVPTRLRKFDESDLDGMILAYAGVHRLGFADRINGLIPIEIMLPAVGQGAIAVEVRDGDAEVFELVSRLNDIDTETCITAERSFLRKLEGGCQVPIGAYATTDGEHLVLEGMVGSLDGKIVFRETVDGHVAEAAQAGIRLADSMIAKGSAELLNFARSEVEMSMGAVDK